MSISGYSATQCFRWLARAFKLVALAKEIGLDSLWDDRSRNICRLRGSVTVRASGRSRPGSWNRTQHLRRSARRARPKYLHLLAYFPAGAPSRSFVAWISAQQAARKDRNRRLISSLHQQGIDITLEEVEARGRSVTGRPHFAQILSTRDMRATRRMRFSDSLEKRRRRLSSGFRLQQSRPLKLYVLVQASRS